MTEEDKVLKRQKIEQNRAKKRPQQESSKLPKLKREDLDDGTFDQETASIPSVASESYIWESDRKYTDLDGNRQQTTDSLSPVAAASVPSPSSPPEGASIASSKTLDMLTDQNVENYDQNSSRFEHNQVSFERAVPSHIRYAVHTPPLTEPYESPNRFHATAQKVSRIENTTINPGNFELGISRYKSSVSVSGKSSSTSSSAKFGLSRFQGNLTSTSGFDFQNNTMALSGSFAQKPSSTHSESSMGPRTDSEGSLTSADGEISRGRNVCHKPKVKCPKESNLISKVMQEPHLIAKILSNPDFAAKIFQDQGFIAKIIADMDTVSRLVSDPQISKFLEENDVSSTDEITERPLNPRPQTNFNQTLANNGISDNMIKHMLDGKEKQAQNPILTNLITNRKSADCKNANAEPSTSGDWFRASEDVTRDILQDVQR